MSEPSSRKDELSRTLCVKAVYWLIAERCREASFPSLPCRPRLFPLSSSAGGQCIHLHVGGVLAAVL